MMPEITVEAKTERLGEVTELIHTELEKIGCGPAEEMQIALAAEEVFVNICHYAYTPGRGDAVVRCEADPGSKSVAIEFEDSGVPYDPLKKQDPDITLGAEERAIGGLGIFMVKSLMDEVSYKYQDKKNILTMKKSF